MSPQQKQSEHAVVDSVGVDRHGGTRRSPQEKRCAQAGAPFSSVLNFVHHNVSRRANKPWYRRVERSGNPQVSATSFRFGKRTALALRRLVRCRHRAVSVVPWSARSMRFARPRFNRSPPARPQPDRLYCLSDACLMQNCSRLNSQMITSFPNEYVAHSPVFLSVFGGARAADRGLQDKARFLAAGTSFLSFCLHIVLGPFPTFRRDERAALFPIIILFQCSESRRPRRAQIGGGRIFAGAGISTLHHADCITDLAR
jgi:hypothetical protein